MTVADALAPVVAGLETAGIPYMVVGSIASSLHGELRATQDIDIVIDPTRDALAAFVAAIPERFYVDRDVALDALARRSMFNLIDTETGWKIDLIVRKPRPFSLEELARRQESELGGVRIYVASLEDTIVSKLEWAKLGNSARQLDDVRRLIGVRGDMLDRAYIARWVDELGLAAQWAEVTA